MTRAQTRGLEVPDARLEREIGTRLNDVEAMLEKVVRSDHGVQKDSQAILEVRRILLKHIGLAPAPPRVAGAPDTTPRS